MRLRSRMLRLLVPLAAIAAFFAFPAVGMAAERLAAIDDSGRLVTFSSDTPRAITRVSVTGLGTSERLVGLDVRPVTGALIGLSSSSRLYLVNPDTGAATAVGSAVFAPALTGSLFGFDFNPTVDRIRVTTDARQNLRLNPDTGANAATDGQLAYATTDPGNGATPAVTASAYTNSRAGATTTQLFNIEAGRDVLVLQSPPNNGTLVTVGALGVDTAGEAGFDIAASDGMAYAALRVAGQQGSGLYRIDLTTGAATLVGRVGGGSPLRALAALGTAVPDTTAPTLQVTGISATLKAGALRTPGLTVRTSCNEACNFTAQLRIGSRVVGTARATTDLSGAVQLRVRISASALKTIRSRNSVRVTLRVTATDVAGNAARPVARTIVARR